ncbi:thiaminase II [Amaricoccus solimangrovi]|uniref:Aminopyrimidine aminohydrolase n=1 Tax=Amaricoccus solimangrovi TaxID=2589815 RepID=A0A501WMM0_9RHOB|nr:thiaminase II [Amaricoccus solimangrovi]TPE51023.1 thiaminase II [Amaricoccus solimangrovi]
MSGPDYGRTFALWRAGAGEVWGHYTRHAFVEGLRDGSLPRAAFLHYLRQDYVFLIHFARAWALAVARAETLAEMRPAAATVAALVDAEMSLHLELCAREGIDAAALEATEEAPENLAYTRYVLEAGYSGDFLDLMAALAPCVLGYGEIGARLGAEAAPGTGYAEWIGTYGGEDYQAVCRDVGALIDAAAERRIGSDFAGAARWPRLAGHFRTATRLEVGFWDMGLRGR